MNEPRILDNFVVFEGIDGAGKSTQLDLTKKVFAESGLDIAITCEPGDGAIGKFIRTLLDDDISKFDSHYNPNLSSILLAHLFSADRYEHIYSNNGIFSLLETHDIVISDRYLFSSIAYQGDGEIERLSYALNASFPLPQLLVYFDITAQKSMERMQHRNKDSMERLENLERVYHRYEKLLNEFQKTAPQMNILRIDACLPVELINQEIQKHIRKIVR